MGLGPNWYQIGNKICYIPKIANFCRKAISMLTNLKVPSLACTSGFFRPEHNRKGEPRGIEVRKSWNTEMKYTNG